MDLVSNSSIDFTYKSHAILYHFLIANHANVFNLVSLLFIVNQSPQPFVILFDKTIDFDLITYCYLDNIQSMPAQGCQLCRSRKVKVSSYNIIGHTLCLDRLDD